MLGQEVLRLFPNTQLYGMCRGGMRLETEATAIMTSSEMATVTYRKPMVFPESRVFVTLLDTGLVVLSTFSLVC